MSISPPASDLNGDDLPDIQFVEAAPELLDGPPPVEPGTVPPDVAESTKLHQWLLLGAGYAHLQVVRWWGLRPIPGVRLTLISAFDRAVYGGHLPDVIAGTRPVADMQIDLSTLCQRSGVQLIVDRAVALDVGRRTVTMAHQPEQSFDLASINIGCVPADERLWQTHRTLVGLQPLPTFVARFEARLAELVSQWRMAEHDEAMQLAVIGGGPAGVELALALAARCQREQLPAQLRLLERGEEILPGYPLAVVRRARELLFRRGIAIRTRATVAECDEDFATELVLEGGARLRVDLAIWAAGAAPPAVLRQFQLPRSPAGFLKIRPTLQVDAAVPVFAAGSIAEWPARELPKAGVSAVRQARILWENLRRWQAGRELIEYRPQRTALSLLNTADGRALLHWNGWSCHNRLAGWLKRRLDADFVRQFR